MVDTKDAVRLVDASPEQLRTALQNSINENQDLREQIAVLKRMLFGRRRESSDNLPDGQTNLFNEHIITGEEQSIIDKLTGDDRKVAKKKLKKATRTKSTDLNKLPLDEQDCLLEGEERKCPVCGEEMQDIGRSKVREEATLIPAQLLHTIVYRHTYACPNGCLNQRGNQFLKKSDVPRPAIPHSPASSSVLTESIMAKFAYKIPDNRQERLWHSRGVDFTRQSIANWHIKASEGYLESLYKLMHRDLLAQDVIHADETPYRVLDLKKAQTYYWVYTSSKHSAHQIVMYEHGNSRGYEEAARFLAGYEGYLQSDAYAVYPNLLGVTNVFCWAHVRRKFDEAVTAGDKGLAPTGRQYCNDLFQWEKKWQDLSADECQTQREQRLKPVMDAFFAWLVSLDGSYLPKSKVGKAITYALKHEAGLRAVLLDGRLELSNNRAERAVKELVIGRKNWLFSQSKRGATAAGVILSLLTTARANHLDPSKYFNYLFDTVPNLPAPGDMVALQDYLPWAPKVQAFCHE